MPLKLAVGTTGDDNPPDDRTLARFGFGKVHEIGADQRSVTVGLPPLDGSVPFECWRSERLVETGRQGEIAFASDGRFVFGHLLLQETVGSSLEMLAHHAYTSILECLKAFGGLHLLRVWNYLDAINEDQPGHGDQTGMERYRSFCIGRSRALADQGFTDEVLPAACAVGSTSPGLMISFLAASEPGSQIENPRQVSAFRYPRQYGPKSPSFSRALTFPLTPDQSLLFISGTASIVGHETMHPGLLDAQFEETCRNLDAVRGAAGLPNELQALRLYVRNEDEAPLAITACRRHFGDKLPILPLKSAICRRELLVEIEGVAFISTSSCAPK